MFVGCMELRNQSRITLSGFFMVNSSLVDFAEARRNICGNVRKGVYSERHVSV